METLSFSDCVPVSVRGDGHDAPERQDADEHGLLRLMVALVAVGIMGIVSIGAVPIVVAASVVMVAEAEQAEQELADQERPAGDSTGEIDSLVHGRTLCLKGMS